MDASVDKATQLFPYQEYTSVESFCHPKRKKKIKECKGKKEKEMYVSGEDKPEYKSTMASKTNTGVGLAMLMANESPDTP